MVSLSNNYKSNLRNELKKEIGWFRLIICVMTIYFIFRFLKLWQYLLFFFLNSYLNKKFWKRLLSHDRESLTVQDFSKTATKWVIFIYENMNYQRQKRFFARCVKKKNIFRGYFACENLFRTLFHKKAIVISNIFGSKISKLRFIWQSLNQFWLTYLWLLWEWFLKK